MLCWARVSPESDVYVLPDQTKIDYWLIRPHEMLKHHARYIFSDDDRIDAPSVDITVGGNHGKGSFQMILKLIVR